MVYEWAKRCEEANSESFGGVSAEKLSEQFDQLPKDLRSVLREARYFVNQHSEPWYYSGQILLARIDEKLNEIDRLQQS